LPDRQRDYRRHIDETISAAKRLIAGHTRASLADDEVAVAAMERFLERIPEASRRLDPELKARHPAIPWSDIAGIGNVLRHDYDKVDISILWNIGTKELDALAAAVEAMCIELDRGAPGSGTGREQSPPA
jgi:uncharacterized protein with HEPN domain